jgi:hypothetical protein
VAVVALVSVPRLTLMGMTRSWPGTQCVAAPLNDKKESEA